MSVAKRGSCPCGAVEFEAHQVPSVRFYCHCQTCQALYDRPYVDLTAARTRDVKITRGADKMRWIRRHLVPASVHRGLCTECERPVLGRLQSPVPGITFIATSNWEDEQDLPEPVGHGYYHRRIRDVDDGLPKASGLVGSQLAFTRWIVVPLYLGR